MWLYTYFNLHFLFINPIFCQNYLKISITCITYIRNNHHFYNLIADFIIFIEFIGNNGKILIHQKFYKVNGY